MMLVKPDILHYQWEFGREFLQDVIVRMEQQLTLINVFIELIVDLLLLESQEKS